MFDGVRDRWDTCGHLEGWRAAVAWKAGGRAWVAAFGVKVWPGYAAVPWGITGEVDPGAAFHVHSSHSNEVF